PQDLQAVQAGMLSVTRYNAHWAGTGVDSPAGTAYGVFADFPVPVAGKTGTAETGRRDEEPYGWFIAYAPFDKPEVAVAVMIRQGGGGSLAAAPVARAILEAYFQPSRTTVDTSTPFLPPSD
ncbi:MAG: hypothetical protein IRY95_10660, partial [Clostridia bacterium]|nr:hypothetical protein [Clostridia bacterium]